MPQSVSTDHANRWLNASEAGQYLGFSSSMIRSFCRRNLLTHSKMPGRNSGYRFRVEWLDEFADSRVSRSTIVAKPSMVNARTPRASSPETPQQMLTRISKQLKEIAK